MQVELESRNLTVNTILLDIISAADETQKKWNSYIKLIKNIGLTECLSRDMGESILFLEYKLKFLRYLQGIFQKFKADGSESAFEKLQEQIRKAAESIDIVLSNPGRKSYTSNSFDSSIAIQRYKSLKFQLTFLRDLEDRLSQS